MTTGVFDYKLYNNIYNSQTVVSWSLEGQVWDGQVYMSGPEAWSSFQASLGTGTAHDRDIKVDGVHTWGVAGESGFIWTFFMEGSFP